MPRKDGTLSSSELRRLIKQHNKLMSIQIPKGTNRDGLIKLITKNGYTINHSAQKLEPTVKMKRKPVVKLPPAPVKKTEEEKKQAKDKRDKKRREIEAEGIKKALALQKILKKKTSNNKKSMEENKNQNKTNIIKKDQPKKDEYNIGDIISIDQKTPKGIQKWQGEIIRLTPAKVFIKATKSPFDESKTPISNFSKIRFPKSYITGIIKKNDK